MPQQQPIVNVIRQGLTMGTALAMICSFGVNKSIIWAVVHGVLSWIYVIYFAMAY